MSAHARRPLFAAGAWMLAVLCGGAQAHPGYFGTAFHAHNLPDAVTAAVAEHKLIFVYVDTEGGWPAFRWMDAEKRELVDALVRETVIVELKPTELGAVEGYVPNAPEILLLDEQRHVVARFEGDMPVPALARALKRELAGNAAVARAESLRAKRPAGDFFARERLANALWDAGQHEQAMPLIEGLANEVVDDTTPAARSRAPWLTERLARWSREDKSARALTERVVDRAERRLTAGASQARLAESVARLHEALGQKERTLQLFGRLKGNPRAQAGLLDRLAERLVRSGRGAEVLDLVDPIEAFAGEREFYDLMRVSRPAQAEMGEGRGTRAFVIERALLLIEAARGAGRPETAAQLEAELLGFDGSDATRRALAAASDPAAATSNDADDASRNAAEGEDHAH